MSGWFDEGTEDTPEAEAHAEPRGGDHDAKGGAGGGAGPEVHDGTHREAHVGAESETAGGDADPDEASGSRRERYRVKGDDLLAKVKQLVREGNIRKITIRNDEDKVLLSFPLAAGVLGAALLPVWAGVGAVAALVGNCSIDVERRE